MFQRFKTMRLLACLAVWAIQATIASSAPAAEASAAQKIVLIAGTVHQGPGGHPAGTHEYELSARLLKHALETARNVSGVKAEVHLDGWPRDPKTLDDADTIVVLSDGADRKIEDHPLLVGDRLAVLKKQMDRGCGLVAIHWTVFVPRERGGEEFLDWIGGYFDYQSGNAPNHWFSKIKTAATAPRPAAPEHPICRGVGPFELREEYYYNMRFRASDPRRTPILSTAIPGEQEEQTVAWCVERSGGGRGFGFTGGHFFDNWGVENFRRLVLNAILWTAHAEVPAGGVISAAPRTSEPPAAARDKPIQALIVTGHQHPAHSWRETTVALQEALSQDRRYQLTVVTDPEFLADKNLSGYDVVLLNYCNWQRGGLSELAQANFQKYLRDGGGLAIIHFANGAFHASLPQTPGTDWPEYRNICRRVWDHTGGRSSHDPYGRFRVELRGEHPITVGLNSFETIDELYCNQQGDAPIEVLATAHSKVTNRDEPMAFVYSYGKGRIFQTVLGHAAESIRTPGEAALIRRGCTWAAGHEQRAVAPAAEKISSAPPKLVPQGRFGAGLDPRGSASWAARKELYDRRPLTVECWARLNGKTGFNILVANNSKESAEHWELYSYAGSGELSLYVPGFEPAEIKSGVDVVDGQWHYLAAAFDEKQARLFVDGKMVKQTAIQRARSGGPPAELYFGGYPPHNIACDGLLDEVRISKTLRACDELPSAPFSADEPTIGLWHFDRIEQGTVEDVSGVKNPAVAGRAAAQAAPLLTRRVAGDDLQLITIDTSADESFLSMRSDTTGRLFVGGREALFVYEPDSDGLYKPRQLLYRFPPDSWITDVEVRGDDLYVMTNAALYLLPGARVARSDIRPRRLLWGTPVDLHVTWHGLAWGPEGDLYFSSGDPLLNYGDFQNRPDHWGHWTIYTADGGQVPYTGMGGFFRCRPDGTHLRVVAGGTRGAVGLAFDRRWNLFSNDNDHESIADRYSPARVLHVAPKAHFFWPRGWIASMSPDRSDLLEIVNSGLGREAPVGQTYYDETRLPPKYRDSLLVACWGQRKVAGFRLAPRGASYRGEEFPLLIGEETARPVGVAVGRGGRIFVALSYMAGNEWSPKYPGELVMITRADDSPTYPFDAYDAPSAPPERLWSELSNPSWWRRQAAHVELMRRGGDLLEMAVEKLKKADPRDPALMHLPHLAAASGTVAARDALIELARHADPTVRAQAIRALAEYSKLDPPAQIFAGALEDTSALVRHAALVALFERSEPLPPAVFAGCARSHDTYLRQASAFLIAARGRPEELDSLLAASDPAGRLAGVLAAGFRLTVPESVGKVPAELPLRYESGNALFTIQYADAQVDLKSLARVGSFTTAERWKAVPPSEAERQLVELLIARLSDDDERVAYQAGYFLSLLNDERAGDLVSKARRRRTLSVLESAPRVAVHALWTMGPLDDGSGGLQTPHPLEQSAVDLSARIVAGRTILEWREWKSTKPFELALLSQTLESESSYLFFRLQTLESQPAALSLSGVNDFKLWHNGRALGPENPAVLALGAGSNDVLLRVPHSRASQPVTLCVQARSNLELTLPEKLGSGSLAERLKQAAKSTEGGISQEFLAIDWASASLRGDAARGRKLFAADALGCAKCHAVTLGQKGGGAPSLAAARSRFTAAHLVESILVPNKQVAPVFGTTTIVTTDGQAFSGLAVEETEREVVLLLPTAARHRIQKSEIEDRKLQATSPMPSGLVRTPDELRDLLAYLMSPNPQAP